MVQRAIIDHHSKQIYIAAGKDGVIRYDITEYGFLVNQVVYDSSYFGIDKIMIMDIKKSNKHAYTYVLDYYSGLINLDYPQESFINRSNGVRFDCYYNSDIFKFSFVIIFSG